MPRRRNCEARERTADFNERSDPSGDTQTIAYLRDQVAQLAALAAATKVQDAALKKLALTTAKLHAALAGD